MRWRGEYVYESGATWFGVLTGDRNLQIVTMSTGDRKIRLDIGIKSWRLLVSGVLQVLYAIGILAR